MPEPPATPALSRLYGPGISGAMVMTWTHARRCLKYPMEDRGVGADYARLRLGALEVGVQKRPFDIDSQNLGSLSRSVMLAMFAVHVDISLSSLCRGVRRSQHLLDRHRHHRRKKASHSV